MAADYYCRKSGPQIPAFGDWEKANELPITQYFECARQAGFLRCSCPGECGGPRTGDYHQKALPRRVNAPPQRMTSDMNKDRKHSNEQRKQVKMRDHNKYEEYQPRNLTSQQSSITIKPVDEDLYKIPSELLENSKRVNMDAFNCIIWWGYNCHFDLGEFSFANKKLAHGDVGNKNNTGSLIIRESRGGIFAFPTNLCKNSPDRFLYFECRKKCWDSFPDVLFPRVHEIK